MNDKRIAELEAEKDAIEMQLDALKHPKPEPLPNPDFSSIIDMCKDHVANKMNNKSMGEDENEEFMFETVMQVVYGEDIFDKLRNS